MKRLAMQPRPDFSARAAEIGFEFANLDGQTYWDESVAYRFSLRQIEEDLEAPTEELGAMAMEAVDRAVRDQSVLRRLKIPDHAHDLIATSWTRRDPALYGRFDFSYDGKSAAKLLEFNADTPTSLFEAGVVQWFWLQDLIARGQLPASADQFNSLHEKLIARWAQVTQSPQGPVGVHLAGVLDNVEDKGTLAYLAETATQAGLQTQMMPMADIGLVNEGSADALFVDRAGAPIVCCFKLYPWEWMFAENFGASPALRNPRWLEPPWKAVLSNKGLLALLWALAPGHPNLLPAYFEDDPRVAELGATYARKPLLSREGANIKLVQSGATIADTAGDYGGEGYVRQALRLLPDFGGVYPVIGSWLVGDQAAGMGVREDSSPVTANMSRFVPHFILD